MFVNDVNSSVLQHQNQVELQQRAAEERLAHQYLDAHREDRPSLFERIAQLFGTATLGADRPAVQRHAHRHAH